MLPLRVFSDCAIVFFILIKHSVTAFPVNPDSSPPIGASSNLFPEQDHSLSEGDILDLDLAALIEAETSPRQESEVKNQSRRKRNAVVFSYFRWSDGIIPFTLDILYNKTERMHILTAMNEFHGKTCIRFTPRSFHKDFLSIIKHRGCASKIGRQGGRQPLFLNQECIDPKRPGIVMHELMHSLGFLHEQTRHDRDDFIDVLWNNIAPDHQDNFAKVDQRLVGIYDAPYDYGSVMHYGPNFFAVNYTNPTIIPKKPTSVLGQRTRLSDADAMKINKLYHCDSFDQQQTAEAAESTALTEEWSIQ